MDGSVAAPPKYPDSRGSVLLMLPFAACPQPIELVLVVLLCAGRLVYAPGGGGLDVRAAT